MNIKEFDPLTNRYFHVFKICYEYRIENGARTNERRTTHGNKIK